ncbi:MAG: 50S ribosomal protein L30 [SAR324 cluster bacterium]|nr:50S ribosomal protein L30 [SAR324 cluster bacterium]
MSQKIKVKLIRSTIERSENQKANLKGLGLKRINQERILKNTACVRGMIRKVQHLVEIQTI